MNDFKKAEEKIMNLEDRLKALEQEMSDPSLAADFTKLAQLSEEAETVNGELEETFAEWERLQNIIEENGYEV